MFVVYTFVLYTVELGDPWTSNDGTAGTIIDYVAVCLDAISDFLEVFYVLIIQEKFTFW